MRRDQDWKDDEACIGDESDETKRWYEVQSASFAHLADEGLFEQLQMRLVLSHPRMIQLEKRCSLESVKRSLEDFVAACYHKVMNAADLAGGRSPGAYHKASVGLASSGQVKSRQPRSDH